MSTETEEQKAAEAAAPAERAPKAKAEPKAAPKRYAAYNKSLGRFVGGVRETRSEVDKIAKGIREAGYDAEVREV